MTLTYPANLRLVVLNADIVDHPLEIAFHRDVSPSLKSGEIFHPAQKTEMPNASWWVAKSDNSSVIVVVRGYDFIAKLAIVGTPKAATQKWVPDLLGRDNADDSEWIAPLKRRTGVHRILKNLNLPFALVVWKDAAEDRLSKIENTP